MSFKNKTVERRSQRACYWNWWEGRVSCPPSEHHIVLAAALLLRLSASLAAVTSCRWALAPGSHTASRSQTTSSLVVCSRARVHLATCTAREATCFSSYNDCRLPALPWLPLIGRGIRTTVTVTRICILCIRQSFGQIESSWWSLSNLFHQQYVAN